MELQVVNEEEEVHQEDEPTAVQADMQGHPRLQKATPR